MKRMHGMKGISEIPFIPCIPFIAVPGFSEGPVSQVSVQSPSTPSQFGSPDTTPETPLAEKLDS